MFVPNMIGTLMRIEDDATSRYRYEIWFDYTRVAINTIMEGAMLAVPNFACNGPETHYSILEVSSFLPTHYALGDDTRGYPGFVAEATKNAGQDWLTQEDKATEDTTKIRCIAIPTNIEIVEHGFTGNTRKGKTANDAPFIQEEQNIPMVGHEVRLLDTAMTERIANRSLDLETENLIRIGHSVRDSDVNIYLRVEELVKVHFGIFGFTGAGKSNLLSTIVRKLLTESKEPVKIVFFDLMGEYTGLLIDQLHNLANTYVVNIGNQTVPESVINYYKKPNDQDLLKSATKDYVNSMVLPKKLKQRQEDLYRPFARVLKQGKVRLIRPKTRTVKDIIDENEFKGNLGNTANEMVKFRRTLLEKFGTQVINPETFKALEKQLNDFRNTTPRLPQTSLKLLDALSEALKEAATQPTEELPENALIGFSQIIDLLNKADSSSLIICQAHDPDALREFVGSLSGAVYESRRRSGRISPLVSFIFDEADEFIPGQTSADSQRRSKAEATMLARRGRKFGLGIGIATQRIRYLDTSILAQPHTYFVSKLPRLTDRQAIVEAFGISEEMFRQTFRFQKGDWLLASYDATGLEAIPIPIHAENADNKIADFIDQQKQSS